MSETDETRRQKLEWKMRQRLLVSWVHAVGCPEEGRQHSQRPERCRCGMPPITALEAAREAALENLRWGLQDGNWKPPGRESG